MKLTRIKELWQELETGGISYGELSEIEDAFAELDPATLRDLPENATAIDMLNELESAVRVCTNCGRPARDDGSEYVTICAQWPDCVDIRDTAI